MDARLDNLILMPSFLGRTVTHPQPGMLVGAYLGNVVSSMGQITAMPMFIILVRESQTLTCAMMHELVFG